MNARSIVRELVQDVVQQEVNARSPHEGKSGSFRLAGSGNLAAQGLTPAKRAKGMDVTGALRVGWSHAKMTGEPATVTHTGRGGLTILRSGERLPYNQSHMIVHPSGDVHKFHPAKF
jgi:hypothetical protein